jgi:putative SOS response-associated peptidase YedK
MAGLWDIWQGSQGEVLSCSIIVTEANRFMKPLHDRMPVILDPKDYAAWLDPDNHDTARLKRLLAPAPEDLLTEWKVSRELNNPRHEGAGCALPAE